MNAVIHLGISRVRGSGSKWTGSTEIAPASLSSLGVASLSNRRSRASMPSMNASSVTWLNRSLRKNGCQTFGSLFAIHMPKKLVNTASKIVVSNPIGTLAGIDHAGLPEMFHGQLYALHHHC